MWRRCARSSFGSESLAARAAFSSPLAEELATDVLERFLRYVRVDTQGAYRVAERPSTQKQLDLSRMLVDELREIGLADAELNDGYSVFATLPGTSDAPVIGLIAHVDTTPDVTGAGVSPIVHEAWDGRADQAPGRRATGARARRASRARRARRPRHRHERRDDAPRCRRQGGDRGDHGRRRVPRPSRGAAAGSDPGRVHGRRGGRPRRGGLRPGERSARTSRTRSTARISASSRSRRSRLRPCA